MILPEPYPDRHGVAESAARKQRRARARMHELRERDPPVAVTARQANRSHEEIVRSCFRFDYVNFQSCMKTCPTSDGFTVSPVERFELVPSIVEVHEVLQQPLELAALNQPIAVHVRRMVPTRAEHTTHN